jgi:hypothetical protein
VLNIYEPTNRSRISPTPKLNDAKHFLHLHDSVMYLYPPSTIIAQIFFPTRKLSISTGRSTDILYISIEFNLIYCVSNLHWNN